MGRPVELAYGLTVDDLAAVIRTRAKFTRAGRFRRRLLVFTLVIVAVGVLLSTLGDGHRDTPWPLYPALVAVAFMTAVPRLQARQFHRLSERQGDVRAVVDDTGISASPRPTARPPSTGTCTRAAPRPRSCS